jgi:ATP phosphoribosyltransferase
MTAQAKRGAASQTDPIILALPKGRILPEVMPLLVRAGIRVEPDFENERSRKLRFHTNIAGLTVVRVRSFDVATFVAFGAAHLGVAGSDVLMEFDYPELYAPIDLGVGRCRIAVAEPKELIANDDPSRWSHVRVATKYPETARRYFGERGVQAECIALSGAMELAPQLGLCTRIVDLVQTGATLKANGLAEIETIAEVSARLVVNRTALKLHPEAIGDLVTRIQEAVDAA